MGFIITNLELILLISIKLPMCHHSRQVARAPTRAKMGFKPRVGDRVCACFHGREPPADGFPSAARRGLYGLVLFPS